MRWAGFLHCRSSLLALLATMRAEPMTAAKAATCYTSAAAGLRRVGAEVEAVQQRSKAAPGSPCRAGGAYSCSLRRMDGCERAGVRVGSTRSPEP